jgi:hypothetical protein
MVDVFRNPAKSIPTSDEQIIRPDLESDDLQGRKSHLPAQMKSGSMGISHVPNAGSNIGSK